MEKKSTVQGAEKNRIEDCTIGPVPVTGIIDILRQLREHEWKVTFVAFAGTISMQPGLSLSRPVPMPSYLIIAEKLFGEGEEFVPPKINLDRPSMTGPSTIDRPINH